MTFIILCGAVRSAFLPLLFVFSIQSADAGICDSLARAFRKAEAIEASVENVRKNLVATFFKPEELKSFDMTFFDLERERLTATHTRHPLLPEDLVEWDPPRPDEPYNDVTPPAPGKSFSPPIDVSALRFETKLAYLEVAIQSANGERVSLKELLNTLPAYKKVKLIDSVNALFSGKPVTDTALQYQISDLYIDLMKWHYPHLLEGAGSTEVEKTLRSTLETRMVSRNIAKTLKDAGLINENPNVFKNAFESLLKGQAVQFFINSQINYAIIKGALNSNLIPYWIVPPMVRFNRWIEIPEEMLIAAENQGLEPAWETLIKPYLLDRYGTLTRVDLVYSRLQKFWSGATYYAFMGWLAFTLTWTVPTEVKIQVRQKGIQEQFESIKTVSPSLEKSVLSESEKRRKWNEWARQHPEAARDSTSPEYRFMQRIIFGTR